MCGLFGIINKDKDTINVAELQAASMALQHRGPDDDGIFTEKNIGLAHQRLSIFDPGEGGRQPFAGWNKVLVFNGAIYNFPEIKKQLLEYDYQFKTETDTEVLLAAYDHWGKDCVQHFNGQWAFAIYDRETEKVFCSRDRFGIKPFYYTEINGKFCFSSEIKAFIKISGWKAKLNKTKAYEYLVHQMHDHTCETLFDGVYRLGNGQTLSFDLKTGSYKIATYYDLKKIVTQPITVEKAVEKFSEKFIQSVQLRLRADVPVGAALSGGLDSSAIVLTIPEIKNDISLSTFSVVYDEAKISERKYVEAVLKNDFIKGHILQPSFEEYENNRKKVLWQQEEPYNGIGVEAQHSMFAVAREAGVKVMLDGQGADEILAGYEKFYLGILKSKTGLLKKISTGYQLVRLHQIPWKKSWEDAQNYFLKNKRKQIRPWLKLKPDPKALFQRSKENSVLAMSKNLIAELGLNALLRYEDKNAMSCGIESRVPFLDHELVEFCLSLPADLKIRKGIRKWILRESRKEVLPDIIRNRYDKLGFATPEIDWLQGQKSRLIGVIEGNERLTAIIDFAEIKKVEDLKVIWRVYLFGAWMEMFNIDTE